MLRKKAKNSRARAKNGKRIFRMIKKKRAKKITLFIVMVKMINRFNLSWPKLE
jgi:hypothetical protein